MTTTTRHSSAARGYYVHPQSGFQACLSIQGRKVSLGYYRSTTEAAAARKAALKVLRAVLPSLSRLEALESVLLVLAAHSTASEGPRMPPAVHQPVTQ